MSDECPAPLLYVNSSDGDLPGLILLCVAVACKAASRTILVTVSNPGVDIDIQLVTSLRVTWSLVNT